MSTRDFHDEEEQGLDDFSATTTAVAEVNLSTKLERRRRIEELVEEKRLREELAEFG